MLITFSAQPLPGLPTLPLLTPQAAARARIPLVNANQHAPGTPQWHLFNNAFRHAAHAAECEEFTC